MLYLIPIKSSSDPLLDLWIVSRNPLHQEQYNRLYEFYWFL